MRDDEAFDDVRVSRELLPGLIPASGNSQRREGDDDPSNLFQTVPSII